MEDNDKSIILKRKEYYELVAKSESKKPDYINIKLYNPSYTTNMCYSLNGKIVSDFKDTTIESSLEIEPKLWLQLKRLRYNLLEELSKRTKSQDKVVEDNTCRKIAKMSWRERRKVLKQYE